MANRTLEGMRDKVICQCFTINISVIQW